MLSTTLFSLAAAVVSAFATSTPVTAGVTESASGGHPPGPPGSPPPAYSPPPSRLYATVTYSNAYDNPRGSLYSVACSNGTHGLLTRGYTTFSSLPTFPNVGGAQAVGGWNSPNCGTCWSLSYRGTTINVLAIDSAGNGFNIAQRALDTLTHGQAVHLGRVTVLAQQVPSQVCGL